MKADKLISVRFSQPILLGVNLEPCNSVTDGMHIDAAPVTISVYDAMFLKVQFKDKYQLVPWAAVSTALFQDQVEPKKSK